jgi:hypothetical protein
MSYQVEDYFNFKSTELPDGVASMQHALINDSPNDVPILSDYLSAYMQGNRNSINNNRNHLLFSGQMGMMSSGIGAVASGAMGNIGGMAQGIMSYGKNAGDLWYSLKGYSSKSQRH